MYWIQTENLLFKNGFTTLWLGKSVISEKCSGRRVVSFTKGELPNNFGTSVINLCVNTCLSHLSLWNIVNSGSYIPDNSRLGYHICTILINIDASNIWCFQFLTYDPAMPWICWSIYQSILVPKLAFCRVILMFKWPQCNTGY